VTENGRKVDEKLSKSGRKSDRKVTKSGRKECFFIKISKNFFLEFEEEVKIN